MDALGRRASFSGVQFDDSDLDFTDCFIVYPWFQLFSTYSKLMLIG